MIVVVVSVNSLNYQVILALCFEMNWVFSLKLLKIICYYNSGISNRVLMSFKVLLYFHSLYIEIYKFFYYYYYFLKLCSLKMSLQEEWLHQHNDKIRTAKEKKKLFSITGLLLSELHNLKYNARIHKGKSRWLASPHTATVSWNYSH